MPPQTPSTRNPYVDETSGSWSAAQALRALLGQSPTQPSRMQTPAQAERRPFDGEPMVPPAPALAQGAGPRPVEGPPPFGDWRSNVVMGEGVDLPESPFKHVTAENAAQGLAGLQAAQQNQFNPFGEAELQRLSSRDPQSVQPGSNAMWAGQLKDVQDRRDRMEGIQHKALEGISGAIAGTHPAVQFQAEQQARRQSMPAAITAQGQFRAAQEAAQSRRDVGEYNLERGMHSDRASMADTVMQAIRAIRAKQGGLAGTDDVQLKALQNLYDYLSDPLTGATFEEAYENIEE